MFDLDGVEGVDRDEKSNSKKMPAMRAGVYPSMASKPFDAFPKRRKIIRNASSKHFAN